MLSLFINGIDKKSNFVIGNRYIALEPSKNVLL
jgi:hypothetical protein